MVGFEDPPTAKPIDESSSEDVDTNGKKGAQSQEPMKKAYHFHNMAKYPWPYMIFLPALFIVLIALGW